MLRRFFNNKDSSTMQISKDAYSSGQIESKLWLCREVEKQIHRKEEQTIWIFGGWVGLLSFLLFSRENLNIKNIRSFDLDSTCEQKANLINENWYWTNQKFKAITADCNNLDYKDFSFADSNAPSLIINTSVEHFSGKRWYFNIPSGKIVAIQSCNLEHPEHVFCAKSEDDLKKQFQFTDLLYSGKLDFNYPTSSFSRYMLIGRK